MRCLVRNVPITKSKKRKEIERWGAHWSIAKVCISFTPWIRLRLRRAITVITAIVWGCPGTGRCDLPFLGLSLLVVFALSFAARTLVNWFEKVGCNHIIYVLLGINIPYYVLGNLLSAKAMKQITRRMVQQSMPIYYMASWLWKETTPFHVSYDHPN